MTCANRVELLSGLWAALRSAERIIRVVAKKSWRLAYEREQSSSATSAERENGALPSVPFEDSEEVYD